MKHRKATAETVFCDGCVCISTPESKARRLRQANDLRARSIGVPR
jgi:hypothetical protein